jgi:ribosomal protein L11 methyltransferase
MAWLQIRLQISPDHAPLLADLLSEAGALAVSLEDDADEPLYEPSPGSLRLWARTRLSGLFPEDADAQRIIKALRAELGEDAVCCYQTNTLHDRDWQRECQDQFRARKFGNQLWVCPSWETPPDPDAIHVMLDPGLAFGTGAHPTTALCLEWLAQAKLAGATVIDYGCGSGILAIAAARLGAETVWAVDIDPQALQATAENARINAVEHTIYPVPPESLPPVQADGLLANILARPLIDLAPVLAGRVRNGGWLVLSGILAEQTGEVSAVYAPWFEMEAPVVTEGWVRLQGIRRGTRRGTRQAACQVVRR